MADLIIGKVRPLSIEFRDADGKPMAVTPTPDAAPVWTNSNPAAATLAAAADGLTATETGVAVGTDTVNMTVVVSGVSFAASLDVTVAAPPQVLTTVAIIAGADQ